MKRNEPCAHMRPDYSRLELAHYITRNPVTDEITWEPTRLERELERMGLIERRADPDTRRKQWTRFCTSRP